MKNFLQGGAPLIRRISTAAAGTTILATVLIAGIVSNLPA